MKINTPEYITLQSIRPSENRYRAYRISITLIETSKIIYAVSCYWGRISTGLNHHKHFIFESKKEATEFIKFLLTKRNRNDYSIITHSNSFPSDSILKKLPIKKIFPHQITLFAEAG